VTVSFDETIHPLLKRCSLLLVDLSPAEEHPSPVYDLIANVIHESVAGTTRDKENTVWKVQLRAGSGTGEGEKWFQIQDLIVEEIRKEMIFLGETVIQVRLSSRPPYWH
jgi:U4/U6.U5 tri-snRNP-associated protein 2